MLFVAAFVLCGFLCLLHQIVNRNLPAGIPPGSRGLPVIGETLQFMAAINCGKGIYDFVRIRHLRYGRCFKTNIFGETHVYVSNIESAREILSNEVGKFTKRYIKSIGQLVGNQSILCASHQHHKLIRKSLIPLFSTNSISLFIKHFDQLILQTLARWEARGTVIVLHEALEITFKAMCKILISLENEDEVKKLSKDIALVSQAMLAFPLKLPWTKFSKGLKARERIMSTLENVIRERRKGLKDCREDFLQQLLTEDSNRLTDVELQDNILTMIIAGQDTTASAITWMVKYLADNPKVLKELRTEHYHLAQKISLKSFITFEDLNEMSHAAKVVKESLRMASVVPWFPRLALRDCEIEGFKIKKGWNVNINAKSIHYDPLVYNDPCIFNPSRFDDEPKPWSFLAFGIGGRTCIGMNMAKAMMLVFLHRFVTTYTWKVIDTDSSLEKWAMFARLKNGCPIHVTPI